MTRYRYHRHSGNSLGAVVDDLAHIASRFGPIGALTTGAIGFSVFYGVLPLALTYWADVSKAKLHGPLAVAFGKLMDQVMWERFISPCQWTGVTILLVCSAVAVWKAFAERDPTDDQVAAGSWLAKVLTSLFRHWY